MTTSSTIHEYDEGIIGNSSDNEDENRLSTAIDESYNYATISNETKSLKLFTDSLIVISLTSTISLSVSSSINENNLNSNGQQLINSTNSNNNNNETYITIEGGMTTISTINTLLTTSDDTFRSSSDTNASIEQEHYFDAIVKLTPTKMSFSADLGDDDESKLRIN
ncbi:unnamed protein product [Rotaria sp. Silwood2]|nr:unnamed protein product [Rotaria sp. Silwood2]CAF3436283.1 unnamed protein product [Rotaria sp. Silwood2]CAF4349589.1 unnamed protein product [Rotaria sp. Silwood2]CAF4549542.1 unnamed protein product [Rotaria sp. Silwood2]